MFTSLLSNLQTLISGKFLLSSFFPTLAFWFVNAVMVYLLNGPFASYVRKSVEQTSGFTAIVSAAMLIAVAFFAYALSALLPRIQSLMEGNWPKWLVFVFAPAQMRDYERFWVKIRSNIKLRAGFNENGVSKAGRWQRDLTAAREHGCTNAPNVNNYRRTMPSARAIETLASRRRRALPIGADKLEESVNLLLPDLRANNADRAEPGRDSDLEVTRQLLWDLIDYAKSYADAEYRSLMTKLRFHFGDLPVAPTRMGNVAQTIQGYATGRYNFNFEFFWSRLQLPAQRDKDFGPMLQAAKTQLDFFITSSALTFTWTLFWALWLFFTAGPRWLFLGIALLGPVASYVWYRVAVAQYRTLADLMRSAIDLFRFDLLTALHHPQPGSVQEEFYLWDKIDALHVLYERDDLRYSAPKP